MSFKFLIFNSFLPSIFSNKFNSLYYDYFPLAYYSSSQVIVGVMSRLSFISIHVNKLKNKFFRRNFSSFFDIDFHLSLFLSKGCNRIKNIGLINSFRLRVQDIIF